MVAERRIFFLGALPGWSGRLPPFLRTYVRRTAYVRPSVPRAAGRHPQPSAPMQRGARFFEKKSFPCSVALKVPVATSTLVRSRVMFSNISGFIVFVMLHLWRSRALFFDIPWPPVPSLEISFFPVGALVLYFPVCGAFLFEFLASPGVALWLAGSGWPLKCSASPRRLSASVHACRAAPPLPKKT